MFWSKTFKVSDLDDLSQKVILVTGGTSGLGLASAVGFVSKNATVIISARNDEKGKKAVEEIRNQVNNPNAKLSYGIMDQSDLKSVKRFADWFLALGIPLHVLLLNAGISCTPPTMIDGVESQFLINHLSHFYLVQLLLEKVQKSAPSRIVFVSSEASSFVKQVPNWREIAVKQYEDTLNASFGQYAYSKLANIQTAIELSRELTDQKVWVNSIHPGTVATGIGQKIPFLTNTLIGKVLLATLNYVLTSPQQGALTQIYASVHPEIESLDYRGQYFGPTGKKIEASDIAKNTDSQKDLWKVSQELIKEIVNT
jgi:NAD(P)-dependent dehydrogenase (short-subunit alcohol dehydrogenase family)